MVLGIGVDTVSIGDLTALRSRVGDRRLRRIFTRSEWAAMPTGAWESNEYLATRFAAKEAAFKALAHLLPEGHFDLRLVETRNRADGSPYIAATDALTAVMERAGVKSLLVSLTTEGDCATAFVLAQSEETKEEIR